MTLRDRLLAKMREPNFRPASEFTLSRLLGLNKKEKGPLAAEVRRLLAAGEVRVIQGERLQLANHDSKPAAHDVKARFKAHVQQRAVVQSRPIFKPVPRGGVPPAPPTFAPAATAASAPAPAAAPKKKLSRDRAATTPEPQINPGESIGRIQFRAGGSAFVMPENDPRGRNAPSMQIFPEDTGVALPGDRVVVRAYPGRKGRNTGETVGRVVRIVTREKTSIVGNVVRMGKNLAVIPDDPRFSRQILLTPAPRRARTPAGPADASAPLPPAVQEGDKAVVNLHDWTEPNRPLTGDVTARLGRTHEPRAELLGLYEKYNLATHFPPEVEREAAILPDRVPAADAIGRLDYRERAVFTIDPDDAKDFDDALSYETEENGDVRIGIHIADVSSYVRPGTALDIEAQNRGNSTYLVGTVIPMLPEKLSNGLCSLVEAQDRLCKAVFLTFGRNGKISGTTYANTIIRSRKRLTYKQAYAFLFTDDLAKIRALPLPPKHQTGSTGRALRELSDDELTDLQTWIRALWKIASRLRKDRMAHGSLDLDMPETKIFVDPEGYADRLEKIQHDESHQLIEEFMLAANEAVARLTRTQRLPALYRVHDDPDAERLAEFRQLLGTFQIQVGDLTIRKEVVRLLEILSTHPQGYTLRSQLLRSLQKACYRASPDGHYGLNKKDYTHFTSPIRRYSDLAVHRVLQSYLVKHEGYAPQPGREAGYNAATMERLGEHLSLTEQNSTLAERESVKIKILEFFERELDKKPRTHFTAVITDVRRNGFFVELIESMTFGFVSANVLGDEELRFDEESRVLTGRRRKRRFELNGRLEVVVEKVDRFQRLIDFRPAE